MNIESTSQYSRKGTDVHRGDKGVQNISCLSMKTFTSDIDFINLKPYNINSKLEHENDDTACADYSKNIHNDATVNNPESYSPNGTYFLSGNIFTSQDFRLKSNPDILKVEEIWNNNGNECISGLKEPFNGDQIGKKLITRDCSIQTEPYLQSENFIGGRNYFFQEKILYEEDTCHEFKGHRSISVYDLPKNSICFDRFSRAPVSSTLCGILNTGLGGTVYLGVSDEGSVMGLQLTCFQKDHVVASLHHNFNLFTPKVHPDLWTVNFIEVLKSPDSARLTITQTETECSPKYKKQNHSICKNAFCWCDEDSVARRALGGIVPYYVIEIHIRPWDGHLMSLYGSQKAYSRDIKTKVFLMKPNESKEHGSGNNESILRNHSTHKTESGKDSVMSKFMLARQALILPTIKRSSSTKSFVLEASQYPPVFVDEIGICYYRQNSSLLKLTLDDIRSLLEHRVDEHCCLLVNKIKKRITELNEFKERLNASI